MCLVWKSWWEVIRRFLYEDLVRSSLRGPGMKIWESSWRLAWSCTGPCEKILWILQWSADKRPFHDLVYRSLWEDLVEIVVKRWQEALMVPQGFSQSWHFKIPIWCFEKGWGHWFLARNMVSKKSAATQGKPQLRGFYPQIVAFVTETWIAHSGGARTRSTGFHSHRPGT